MVGTGPEVGLASSESNMNKLWAHRQTLLESMQPSEVKPRPMPPPPLPRGPPTPCPTQNRGAQGKLTFGFIVPRTLQMLDLVNTCRARVPHLLRLLPFPTLKSWAAAATILKGAPTPRFQRDRWRWQWWWCGSSRNAARSESHCPKPTGHLPLPQLAL